MAAKRLAKTSGMDFAIMSGGDIAPLGGKAVTQLHSVCTAGAQHAAPTPPPPCCTYPPTTMLHLPPHLHAAPIPPPTCGTYPPT